MCFALYEKIFKLSLDIYMRQKGNSQQNLITTNNLKRHKQITGKEKVARWRASLESGVVQRVSVPCHSGVTCHLYQEGINSAADTNERRKRVPPYS